MMDIEIEQAIERLVNRISDLEYAVRGLKDHGYSVDDQISQINRSISELEHKVNYG